MIDKLEFLITVASEKSFSRAAELCGVTQPTLSAGIKQLEDSLGVLLVNRSSRFHGLTAEGERVLEWAKRIVGDARAMRQEVRTLREGLSGQLKIAVIPTAEGIVSALTTPYRDKHPHVRFKVVSASSTEVLTMLDNLEIDAGITYLDNEPINGLLATPLYIERYCLFIPDGHPLAEHERVTWHEAAELPLGLLTTNMQNRRIIDRAFKAAGCHPEPALETNSVINLYSNVRLMGLASVMPHYLLNLLGSDPGLKAIPLVEPEVAHSVGLVIQDRDPVAPLVRALRDAAATFSAKSIS